jgi:hypothetical protein
MRELASLGQSQIQGLAALETAIKNWHTDDVKQLRWDFSRRMDAVESSEARGRERMEELQASHPLLLGRVESSEVSVRNQKRSRGRFPGASENPTARAWCLGGGVHEPHGWWVRRPCGSPVLAAAGAADLRRGGAAPVSMRSAKAGSRAPGVAASATVVTDPTSPGVTVVTKDSTKTAVSAVTVLFA